MSAVNILLDRITASPEEYTLEIFSVSLLVLWVLNFFVGRYRNDSIAKNWFKAAEPLLSEQFSELSYYADSVQAGKNATYIKESDNVYKFYASGRRNCIGILCTLELRKRHDLFSLALALFNIGPVKDRLIIEIPVTAMEPVAFALVPKRKATYLKQHSPDLDALTQVLSSKLPHLKALAPKVSGTSLESELLDSRVLKVLNEAKDGFESLHFSDQYPTSIMGTRKVLKFVFRLPLTSKPNLLELALHLTDRVAQFRLRAPVRAAAIKARQQMEAKIQRKIAAQKKAEAKKKSLEDRLAKGPSKTQLKKAKRLAANGGVMMKKGR